MISSAFNVKSSFPICFFNDGKLLIAKCNRLYLLDVKTNELTFLLALNLSFFKRQAFKIKLLSRLLRLGVRYGIPIDDNNILIVFNFKFYEVNIKQKSIKETFDLPRGNRPLNITHVKDVEGFVDGLYYGEYFENFRREAVHIYRRDESGTWDVAFTFPEGTIEHIHNVVPDSFNNCLWILAGDFNNAAGIWMAKDDFKNVEPIVQGEQKYRACVAFPTSEGLIYATDSQFEKNSIRILKKNKNHWDSNYLQTINGSAIYGCKMEDKFVFSTTVEGDSLSKGKIGRFFDRKAGPGILNKKSQIVIGNLTEGFHVLYENEKDFWPFILFQFGTMIFPTGINNQGVLAFQNVALKYNDMSTSVFKIEK